MAAKTLKTNITKSHNVVEKLGNLDGIETMRQTQEGYSQDILNSPDMAANPVHRRLYTAKVNVTTRRLEEMGQNLEVEQHGDNLAEAILNQDGMKEFMDNIAQHGQVEEERQQIDDLGETNRMQQRQIEEQQVTIRAQQEQIRKLNEERNRMQRILKLQKNLMEQPFTNDVEDKLLQLEEQLVQPEGEADEDDDGGVARQIQGLEIQN